MTHESSIQSQTLTWADAVGAGAESSELRLLLGSCSYKHEDVSSCVGDSAWPLFSGDKLDVTCLTLAK